MIVIKMEDVLNAIPFLKEISNKSFKGAISFKIGRIIRELNKELELFENARQKIIDIYAIRDANGQILMDEKNQIKLTNFNSFNKELQELLNTTIEINVEKIPISVFDNIEITPTQAIFLEAIIE